MKKGYKECPFCKNEIKKEAIKCQFCNEFFDREGNENKENMKCRKKDVSLLKKILYTTVFISFLLLLFGGINPMMHSLDDRSPEYVKLFRIPMLTYFISMLWLTIIYCRDKSKSSLIILGINIFLGMSGWLLTEITKRCDFGYSTTYCYDFGWNSFGGMIMVMSIPILITGFIIYILRLIWGGRKKD